MAGIEEPTTPTRVQFSEDIPVSKNPSTRKADLTMKYDRNTVQKRIDIENWMDEQLKLLYCTEDDYPMLDLDDVYKFEPEQREERLKVSQCMDTTCMHAH